MLSTHLLFAAGVVAAAWAFARLEIQVEGAGGWAAELPTWRYTAPWVRTILGAREITGYHVWAFLFVLLLVHFPFVLFPAAFGAGPELRVLSFFVLFWIVEDFLWFVLNPAYGVSGFNPDDAPWHAGAWWWVAPRNYWIFTPIGVGLYWLSWSV